MNPASPSARAIVIGAASSEQLSMHVTRREFPEASDYWDGNWVYARATCSGGALRKPTTYTDIDGASRTTGSPKNIVAELCSS